MKRTIETNKRLYALIAQLGIDENTKQDMVLSMTKGRTMHTSEMTDFEARGLIIKLTTITNSANRKLNELNQQLRRNVFKLMYDIGLINTDMSSIEKLDYINNWITNKLKINKDLNTLNFDELTSFIRQLQAVRRNYIKCSKKQIMYN
jgi:hypothetical protein